MKKICPLSFSSDGSQLKRNFKPTIKLKLNSGIEIEEFLTFAVDCCINID